MFTNWEERLQPTIPSCQSGQCVPSPSMNQPNGILDRVSDLASELKLADLQPQIAACRKQFNGSHGIDVAVFGRFKAGKSSFLNHLTGRAVLPIGVVPLTAVITRLRFGASERAEVRFLDGGKKEISLDDIGLYVGEDKNPNNEKKVASVEVELPALKLLDPLQFVDTPGLGSAFTHNTEAALNWLPNVGAALVAVSSDAPLSERDLDLLEELRRHTPKIVLLLTKTDLLSESQRAEVLDFVRKQLLRKWQTELPVYFYSIRPEERGLKKELEQKLLSPLVLNRDSAANQIARHKLLSLLAQTLNYLRVAVAAATQAESSRQALREKLADERTAIRFASLRVERALARVVRQRAGFLSRQTPTDAKRVAIQNHRRFARTISVLETASPADARRLARVAQRISEECVDRSLARAAGDVLRAVAQSAPALDSHASCLSRPVGRTREIGPGRDADAARIRPRRERADRSPGACGVRLRRRVYHEWLANPVGAVPKADRAAIAP